MLGSLKKFVLVALACVERLGQRPELDFKLPAGGSVPGLFSSLGFCHENNMANISQLSALQELLTKSSNNETSDDENVSRI